MWLRNEGPTVDNLELHETIGNILCYDNWVAAMLGSSMTGSAESCTCGQRLIQGLLALLGEAATATSRRLLIPLATE